MQYKCNGTKYSVGGNFCGRSWFLKKINHYDAAVFKMFVVKSELYMSFSSLNNNRKYDLAKQLLENYDVFLKTFFLLFSLKSKESEYLNLHRKKNIYCICFVVTNTNVSCLSKQYYSTLITKLYIFLNRVKRLQLNDQYQL